MVNKDFTIEIGPSKSMEITHARAPTFHEMVDRNLRGITLERKGSADAAMRLYEANVRDGFDGTHPYDRLMVMYRSRKDYTAELAVIDAAIRMFTSKLYRENHVAKWTQRRERTMALARKAAPTCEAGYLSTEATRKE